MAVFIVLWPYLSTTKLRCLKKNNIGHTNTQTYGFVLTSTATYYIHSADFRPMAQDNHILFSQVFETVLKPLPKYDVDIVCRDTPTVKKIRNHHRSRQMRLFKIETR